jgi:flagellar hook-length control protein FliK
VQISLKLDDNQAQLQMVSAHSHVRAALEAALPVLRTSLAENGIQLAQSSVSSELCRAAAVLIPAAAPGFAFRQHRRL